MESLKVLINQLQQNAKLKIFDELIISKLEDFLNKLPDISMDLPPFQIQEIFLTYSFDIYNISLELAKSNRLITSQSSIKLYILKLRQICCEFIYFCLEIEQDLNKSSDEINPFDSSSFFKSLLKENEDIFYDLLKIIIRTCIFLLSDLNKFEDIIFKDLSLARMIYTEYIVLPANSEQNLIISILKDHTEKLQIIGLFYLIDLELSIELLEDVPLEILIQSFNKVFDLLEYSEGFLLDSSSKSKLLNIYLKTLVKIVKKQGFQSKGLENLFEISMDNGKLRKTFEDLKKDKNFEVFRKFLILFGLENKRENLEYLLENGDFNENSKESDIFNLALKGKSLGKTEINEEFKRTFIEKFNNLLKDYQVTCEDIFPVLEIVKNGQNDVFLLELISILLKKILLFQEEFIEGFIIYFLNILEEFQGKSQAILIENLDFLVKVFENKKIKPKILLFFLQKVLKFALFLSFSKKSYAESYNILEKLLNSLENALRTINPNISKELLFVQLNNSIMLKNKAFSNKIFNELKENNENISFLQAIIELKFKFFMNYSKNQLLNDLKVLLNHENFNFDVFINEIMGFSLDSGQIKLILETFLDIFRRNSEDKKAFFMRFFEKNQNNGCLLGFFEPLIEDFSNINDQTKDLFSSKFSQEKVKILINLMNFIEDLLSETIFENDGLMNIEISWIINESDIEIFEGIFWNLMILAGNLGLDILFSRKLIYMNLLLKLLPFLRNLDEEKVEKSRKKMPLQIILLTLIFNRDFGYIPSLKLYQILQISILLITNYLATIKMAFKKDKKASFSDCEFLFELIELALKLNDFLIENESFPMEKLMKSHLLLETNRFEFFLMIDPTKCLILLQNQSINCLDPNICVFFSQLASQYNCKSIANQALRSYLKVVLTDNSKNENFQAMDNQFLTISAFRELLKESEEEEEIFSYLKQILIYCDNKNSFDKEEMFYIIYLSLKKAEAFNKESKKELKKIVNIFFEKIKELLDSEQKEKLEFLIISSL